MREIQRERERNATQMMVMMVGRARTGRPAKEEKFRHYKARGGNMKPAQPAQTMKPEESQTQTTATTNNECIAKQHNEMALTLLW